MRAIKLLIAIAIALLVILIGVLFTIHNTTRVDIDLIWFQLPEASLSLWLVSAFALGILVGVVLTSFRNFTLRLKVNQAGRKQRKAELQLQQLQKGSNSAAS